MESVWLGLLGGIVIVSGLIAMAYFFRKDSR